MIDINLLPWREKLRKEQRKQKIVSALVYTVIFLILAVGIHIYYSRKVGKQLKQNQLMTQKINESNLQVAKLQKRAELNNMLKSRIVTLINLDYDRYFTVKLFNEISALTPKGISLTKIGRKNNAMALMGTASSNESITEFVNAIKTSPIFVYPALGEVSVHRGKSKETIKFSLVLGLVVPQHQKELDEKKDDKKAKK